MYEAARKLVEAQRSRGIDPRLGVRVGVPLQDRHGFALAFAELTGTNLRRAREIVRDRPLIVDAAPPGLAMAAAVQIERTGGLVEFELGRIERFAAGSDHPLRGLGPCERLSIRGGALTLTRGRLSELGAGPAERVTLIARGTPSQLFAGFEGERARWAAAGLLDVGSEAELLTRLGAHERRLEARLRAATREGYFDRAEIYGDWLQAHGDPRGLVASASLALARVGDPRTRDQAIATLVQIVQAHASHLLGSLGHELEPAALAWLGPGLVRAKLTPATVRRDHTPRIVAARVPGTTAEDTAQLEQLAYLGPLALLERLLALPVSATIRELELADQFANHKQVPTCLAAAACASGLERMRIDGPIDLRLTGAAFSSLGRLTLTRVRGELVCTLRAPALRRLSVEFDEDWPDLVASLGDLDAPRLRQLELRLRARAGASAASLAPALEALLTRPSFARLRSLTLAGPPAAFEGLEQALARTPAAQTLARIEFPRGG